MAKFNVNLTMSSGMDFYQEFSLTNADFTPLNITNATFHGTVKKHAGAVNALTTTSTDINQTYAPLTTSVVDGLGGVVSVEMSSIDSEKLVRRQVCLQSGDGGEQQVPRNGGWSGVC